MSSTRHHTWTRGSIGSLYLHRCSLPELYASLEIFNKESKKSNLQKICGMSFKEAQEVLWKILGGLISDSYDTVKGDERHPSIPVNKEERKTPSMSDLLHQSLLKGYNVPLEQVHSSQQRLAQVGIPPPPLSFPHGLSNELPVILPAQHFRKRIQSVTFRKLLLSSVAPGRLFYEEKPTSQQVSFDPGKQFLDLADLQWSSQDSDGLPSS
ncbi:uncharacterized protein C9orf153 homolog isoform X2 [Rattus norvegicus]|uniref:uncharacterized protein C9orf153 homolog isoform 2 n=1 Tax=Rattus norvegicus TaxID=10116 RepID=UPI002FD7C719